MKIIIFFYSLFMANTNQQMDGNIVKNKTCFRPRLDNFPKDLFTEEERERGAIAVHWVVSIYLFSILSLLIQAYVIGAIKTMADNFRIATEASRNTMVVGAQLLPEFFASLIGMFVSKQNMGAATVIGSCAANSLLTLGVVGLTLPNPVKLSWYPLWRDNIFYLFTVTILLWTTYDHELKWQECIFLVLVYLVYLLIINFNHKVERGVRRLVLMYRTGDDEQEADQEIEKTPMIGKLKRENFKKITKLPVKCLDLNVIKFKFELLD
jgi:Ca2+/Na+ antiporter